MVTAAFALDPAWAFILNGEYDRLAPHFVEALFDLRVAAGNVWVSEELDTVAMWESPQSEHDSLETKQVWARYGALAGEQAHERLLAYREALAAVAPAKPYWYLGVLATHPMRQREGLASSAMAPVLKQADRDRLASCLETSTEINRRFYERRGFTEATDVLVPGGPPTWWLRRPALAG
jgi:GNAT superfamily N-acetyltransferase